MRKIYAIGLLVMMLAGFYNEASAIKVTLEWNIPGSVSIRTGSLSGPEAVLEPDQTKYVFESESSYGYVYVFATNDYALVDARTTDGSKTYYPTESYHNGKYLIGNVNQEVDGKTITINCKKVNRTDTFTIDVINGVDFLTAAFSSGYTLELREGSNEYKFDPTLDNPLTISLTGVAEAYSVKLGDETIAKNPFYAKYDDINITEGCSLSVQVFENESDIPVNCVLDIKYGEGMEGCITNILNRTTGKFIYPDEIIDNKITVKGKSELRFNFNEKDYSYTKFIFNGTDVTEEFNTGACSLICKLPNEETSVIEIEGLPKVYPEIEFTGYIINADGVQFTGKYQADPLPLPTGESIEEDINVENITMSKEETFKYIFRISGKTGQFFFYPKEGYYIKDLYTDYNGTIEKHPGSTSINETYNGSTFYMIAERIPESYSAKLSVKGEEMRATIKGTNTYSDIWGNPGALNKVLNPGEEELAFIPGYETPLLISFMGSENGSPAVYLDGAPLSGTVDSNSGAKVFSLTPFTPEDGSTLAVGSGIESSITVYNSSTERPVMSGASLELEEGITASFYYSPVMHTANPEGQQVIAGTRMTVRPDSTEVKVTYKEEEVELDKNGEFVFYPTGNARANIVRVSKKDLSGINTNLTDSDNNDTLIIYSIAGRRIHCDCVGNLNSLEKGIYIINGHKVSVK